MRTLAYWMLGIAVFAAGALVAAQADAADRQCQTLLTCNFAKGGSYRGCLSSYSCRQCRFVTASCQIGNSRGSCRKIVCGWAGS